MILAKQTFTASFRSLVTWCVEFFQTLQEPERVSSIDDWIQDRGGWVWHYPVLQFLAIFEKFSLKIYRLFSMQVRAMLLVLPVNSLMEQN